MRTTIYRVGLLFLFGWKGLAASTCDIGGIAEGMSASEWSAKMALVCNFALKAQEKMDRTFPNQGRKVNILTAGKLLTLQNEGIDIIMIIGRSADFTAEEEFRKRDAQAEILSFLRRFNSEKTIFIGGGTPSGDVGLFHEIAVKKGFRVMGITSTKAVDGEPALMTDLYAEPGKNYGVESDTALRTAKAVVMLSGGRQSAREAIKMAYVEKKPLFIIDSSRLGGKTSEVAASFDSNPLVHVFPSAASAAEALQAKVSSGLSILPKGGFDLTEREAREIYHDMFFLGFSTWAENAPDQKSIDEFKTFSVDLLDHLNPQKVVIVVAGSQLHDQSGNIIDGEGFVIHEAKKRGFVILGTPVYEIKPEQLSREIDKFIYTGATWETRNQTLVRNVDGLITAGGSKTIIRHMETAKDWGKPVFHLENINKPIDTFARNLADEILINKGSVGRVVESLDKTAREAGIGSIVQSCKVRVLGGI